VDCISRSRAWVGLILLGRAGGRGVHQAEAEGLTMLDTTPITTEIARLISTGATEQALLAAVAHLFPNLSPAELSAVAGSDRAGGAAGCEEALAMPTSPIAQARPGKSRAPRPAWRGAL
jgi:hypothetical protein